MREMNIRPPDERYGGEGHAGEDPFAERDHDGSAKNPDPAVEIPDASAAEMTQMPNPDIAEVVDPHAEERDEDSGER